MNTTTLRHRFLVFGLGVCTLVAATAAGTTAAAPSHRLDREPRPELDDANVARAITGISLFVIDNSMDLETAITSPCPLMSTDQFGYFMGQQGLTPNLNGWFVDLVYYTDIGTGAPGVSCGVDIDAHLDQVGVGPPHGGNLEAIILPDAATFNDVLALIERATLFGPGSPEIGGELGGVCYTGDRAVCVIMWHRAGMVMTGVLAGPSTEVTQERAVGLLTSMVPTMVQSLIDYADSPAPGTPTTVVAPATVPVPPATVPLVTAAPVTVPPVTVPPVTVPPVTVPPVTAPPVTAPPVTVPSVSVPVSSVPPLVQPTAPSGTFDLAAARATLADFLANNPIGTDVGAGAGITPLCPGSGITTLSQAMTEVGLVPNIADFRVKVVESGIAPGLGVVSCGGDVITALVNADPAVPSHTPLLSMYDITGATTFDQVLAERPGLMLVQSNVPTTIGGEIYGGTCDAPADIGTFCIRLWHREGLIIMMEIGGTGQAGFDTAATDLLLKLVPEVIDDLATNATWPVPAGVN